jgi:enoyl-CoA hydratase/carnithine racemase
METIEREALVLERPAEGVAWVTIQSRPLGVLRHGVKRALLELLHELEADATVRCLVLTGLERAFSVGSDIRDFSLEVGWLLENEYWEAGLNAALEESRLPVIAALNGFALGGGAVLALACDFRIAADSAQMGFPEVKVGAFASGSGTQRLARQVGRGRALELLMTGRSVAAAEALQIGLVEFVVPDAELRERTLALAAEIAANAASAVAASKRCVVVGLRDGWQAGLNEEVAGRIRTGRGPDAQEGRAAFIEKRPPQFNRP